MKCSKILSFFFLSFFLLMFSGCAKDEAKNRIDASDVLLAGELSLACTEDEDFNPQTGECVKPVEDPTVLVLPDEPDVPGENGLTIAPLRTILCTADTNKYGHPSKCACPPKTKYVAKKGLCKRVKQRCQIVETGIGFKVYCDSIEPIVEEPIICTHDINKYGVPSKCSCRHPDMKYDEKVGNCSELAGLSGGA